MRVPVGDHRPVLVVVDRPRLEHRPQDLVAPLDRRLRVEQRVVDRRRLRQTGEQGSLLQAQLARVLGEIDLGSGLDAVGAGAEVDVVQPGLEDPVLLPFLAELDRQARLLDLAAEGAPGVPDVEVAHELLRQRRASLDDLL